MSKPRVFIASSVEGLGVAYSTQANLEYDAECTVWSQGVFTPSAYPLEDIVAELENSDFGIFVFGPDDDIILRDEAKKAVRDNVLIEFGLFVGHLGRKRNFMLMPRNKNLHLPTDLTGLKAVTYDPDRADGNVAAAIGPACQEIRTAISKLGPRNQTVAKVVQQLDEKCIALMAADGHQPYFSQPPAGPGSAIYDHAVARLRELGVLRFEMSEDGRRYAYHWTDLGKMLLNRYGFDKPQPVQPVNPFANATAKAITLSSDAKMILMKAQASGTIIRTETLDGSGVQAGDEELCDPSDDRQQKRMVAAFKELVKNELIEDLGAGSVFEFTSLGYSLADEFSLKGS